MSNVLYDLDSYSTLEGYSYLILVPFQAFENFPAGGYSYQVPASWLVLRKVHDCTILGGM